jgi:hypothetical protein
MYAGIGVALSCITVAFALLRARAPASFYASGVYNMTAQSHRTFAIISIAFAFAFLVAYALPQVIAVTLLAAYALVLIFYFSSFARGFSGEDE